MSGNGSEFEGYVQFVYQTLVRTQGKDTLVLRGATVQDTRGSNYKIDVFYEFDIAGVRHRVAIECKDTSRPVERDDVIAFAGKIRDLPSTVGVFISRNGFQRAAAKYLDDHGILRLAGDDLPRFGAIVGATLAHVALPGDKAIGQPFWTLMELQDGENSGTWRLIPNESGVPVFPLLYSKTHARLLHQVAFHDSPEVGVRGIEQQTLRFVILCAHDENREFAVMQPVNASGRTMFTCEQFTAMELAAQYSAYDLSSYFPT